MHAVPYLEGGVILPIDPITTGYWDILIITTRYWNIPIITTGYWNIIIITNRIWPCMHEHITQHHIYSYTTTQDITIINNFYHQCSSTIVMSSSLFNIITIHHQFIYVYSSSKPSPLNQRPHFIYMYPITIYTDIYTHTHIHTHTHPFMN